MIKVYLSPRILPSLVDLPTEWVESQSHWYIAKVCSNECELKIALTSKGWFDCVDQHFRARPMLHKAQRRQDDQSKERSGYNIFVRTASFFWPARIEWSLMTIWFPEENVESVLRRFRFLFRHLLKKVDILNCIPLRNLVSWVVCSCLDYCVEKLLAPPIIRQ